MTLKFSSEAEDKEIVEKYQSGLYSYSALAEEYNLSKSTIINIVKRYPYNKNKAEDSELITTLKLQRLEAEKKAWEAFAEHRYVDFGVCASKWRDLNTIINDNTKNPFASVIHDSHARNRSRGLRYSSLEKLKQGKVLNELIIEILCKFMDGKDSWEGTATELLSNITIVATESKVNIKMWGFPKNPNQLSAILRDTIKSGIQITKKKRYSGRFLKISKTWTMDGGQVDKKIL